MSEDIETKTTLCDVCGYNMSTNNQTTIGCHVSLQKAVIGTAFPEYDRVVEMFGKAEHKICWCCWLKALGIKPLEHQKEGKE